MFKSADHLLLHGKTGVRPTRFNGPGSKAVLFPKVLCANCNNTRSRPFDYAYDKFVEKVLDEPEYFRSRAEFDMAEIFPDDPDGGAKLARYYVKNIACRIAEVGFTIPQQLVDFMNGAPAMPNGVLLLYKDFSNYDQFRRSGNEGHYPYANRMHNPESPEDGPLIGFCGEVQDGPVGAMFWWGPEESGPIFCVQRRTFLRDRRELPYLDLHEEEWQRADMMKRAQDQQGVPSFP